MSTLTTKGSQYGRWLLLPGISLLLVLGFRICAPVAPHQGNSPGRGQESPEPSRPGQDLGTGGITTLALSQAPKHVRQMIRYLKNARDLKPPAGFKGGRLFRNREGLLPRDKTYYEFDVQPLHHSVSRGAERLVVDQQKSVFFYTRDHYKTFAKIID